MDNKAKHLIPTNIFDGVRSLLRLSLFQVLSFGPMPHHIAVVPDGNRRYGRKHNLREREAYQIGVINLMTMVKYCHEMGIQCVSIYGFGIDNFKRKSTEVQAIMDIIRENTETLVHDTSMVNELGVRLQFLGNLDMLDESIRDMVQKAMDATAKNTKLVLSVCVAYSSTQEIVHGIRGSCQEKLVKTREGKRPISATDLERHMYFSGQPEPDILIRTSGETRLSNFILWQSTHCLLYAPRCLWPEMSLRHLVRAILEYQRNYAYLERIKKKS